MALEMILFQFHAALTMLPRSGNDVVAFHQVNDGHRLAESHQEIIDLPHSC